MQQNNAEIINNIDLKAVTGQNDASKNNGGDSSIKTGDAKIVADIVNFVNNNIQGTGRLAKNREKNAAVNAMPTRVPESL